MLNRNIAALLAVAQKSERRIIGLMSGTSLDGLDVALCKVAGSGQRTTVEMMHFLTIDYTPEIKAEIRKVFARQTIDFPHLAMLNEWIGSLHAQMILDCLKRWDVRPDDVDLIASHGQTVMHAPKTGHKQARFANATLQIGDGDHIAVKTGIVTLSDFRQKHIAAGGEGAPLAVYGDYFMFGKTGENRIMLNMGGIANFTYLPATMDPCSVFVTDTGTGNTLIDAFTRTQYPEMNFDKDALLAAQGSVNQPLLFQLKSNEFFHKPFPKTTGPELFNVEYVHAAQRASDTEHLSANDVLATLTRFSAETIAEAIHLAVSNNAMKVIDFDVYLSGGGMHNPLLVRWLRELLPCKFLKTDDLGIPGDAKEAVLFAILANECVVGGHTDFGTREGIPSVTMGKVSFPW
jgi:1,6-anhydro-N-acetylmuramate kinase